MRAPEPLPWNRTVHRLRVQSLWIKDWIYSDRCYIDQVIFMSKKLIEIHLKIPSEFSRKKNHQRPFLTFELIELNSVWYNWNLNAAQLIWPLFLIADIVLSSTDWNISAGRQCSKLFTTSSVRMWTEPKLKIWEY